LLNIDATAFGSEAHEQWYWLVLKGNGRRCSWQPEMCQDAVNHGRVLDELDAIHPPLAMRADKHLVAEDASEQLRPWPTIADRQVSRVVLSSDGRCSALVRLGQQLLLSWRRWQQRLDGRAKLGIWREDSVETHHVLSGFGDTPRTLRLVR
jgi:hypothetical protein